MLEFSPALCAQRGRRAPRQPRPPLPRAGLRRPARSSSGDGPQGGRRDGKRCTSRLHVQGRVRVGEPLCPTPGSGHVSPQPPAPPVPCLAAALSIPARATGRAPVPDRGSRHPGARRGETPAPSCSSPSLAPVSEATAPRGGMPGCLRGSWLGASLPSPQRGHAAPISVLLCQPPASAAGAAPAAIDARPGRGGSRPSPR